MKKYKRVKVYVKKGLRGTAFVCLGAGLIVTPYTTVVGVATMAKGVSDIYKALNLDYTNNSMITVGRNNVINRIRKTPANNTNR